MAFLPPVLDLRQRGDEEQTWARVNGSRLNAGGSLLADHAPDGGGYGGP